MTGERGQLVSALHSSPLAALAGPSPLELVVELAGDSLAADVVVAELELARPTVDPAEPEGAELAVGPAGPAVVAFAFVAAFAVLAAAPVAPAAAVVCFAGTSSSPSSSSAKLEPTYYAQFDTRGCSLGESLEFPKSYGRAGCEKLSADRSSEGASALDRSGSAKVAVVEVLELHRRLHPLAGSGSGSLGQHPRC